MPMYDELKIPASAMTVTKEMIKISNFDLIDTEPLTVAIWEYFPEDDAFSLGFKTAGIESKLFLENAGLTFYLVLLIIFLAFLHLILCPFRQKCSCTQKVTDRMGKYLYFNGTIRYFMEIYFDICLKTSLNLYTVKWETPFYSVSDSNYFSVAFLVLVCIFPLCYITNSCLRPK